ncbi:MAG: BNR-4 repeat-containing protein [Verrucomicrobia bacterium]|nr:BNR-4 repeat-containing protein [Verrucomicrobiota bacterium]
MKSSIHFCFMLLLVGVSCPCRGDFKVTLLSDSVVDPTAVTAKRTHPYYGGICVNAVHCQQDAVVTHGNHQYVGYIDAERRLCLARRKLPSGDWGIIRFTDYAFKSNDDHCTVCIGLCPKDGTLHMSWGMHNDALTYRVSRKGVATHPESVKWEASLFEPIISELEKGKPPTKVTYPRFWQTPDGGLQFGYRTGYAGKGDRWLVDYEPDTGTWNHTEIYTAGRRKAYSLSLCRNHPRKMARHRHCGFWIFPSKQIESGGCRKSFS